MSELANAATVDALESASPAVPHWHRLLPWVGLALAVVVWWIGAQLLILRTPIAASFAPWPALQALARLLSSGELWPHVVTSMQRVAVGLGLAVAIGVPLGVLTGLSKRFAEGTTPLFQFLRMVSPLSWMPIAVMVLGVGDAPVYFLLAFAAVWPMLLNTAAGVAHADGTRGRAQRDCVGGAVPGQRRLVLPDRPDDLSGRRPHGAQLHRAGEELAQIKKWRPGGKPGRQAERKLR